MTLAAVAIGATLVSGAISAMGAIQQGNAANAAAQRDAQIQDRNAILADQDRTQAVRTAEIAAEDKRRSNRRQYASMLAAYGSSGLDVSGSSLEVLADTSQDMALDERRISYEGTVKNREGALQMLYLKEGADQSRMEGKNAKTASRISAGASLISSVSSASCMKTQL